MEQQGGSFPLTPLEGTYVIGAANAISAILAIGVISFFGRRSILITGHFFMSIWLFVCGLSILYQWNMSAFIMVNLFIATYHLSQGSVAWLYVPEVTVDAASGFAASAQFINLTALSLAFEFMINSALKVHGTIWYFSCFSLLGCLFCIFVVRETRGLTDIQKKALYAPKVVASSKP